MSNKNIQKEDKLIESLSSKHVALFGSLGYKNRVVRKFLSFYFFIQFLPLAASAQVFSIYDCQNSLVSEEDRRIPLYDHDIDYYPPPRDEEPESDWRRGVNITDLVEDDQPARSYIIDMNP